MTTVKFDVHERPWPPCPPPPTIGALRRVAGPANGHPTIRAVEEWRPADYVPRVGDHVTITVSYGRRWRCRVEGVHSEAQDGEIVCTCTVSRSEE